MKKKPMKLKNEFKLIFITDLHVKQRSESKIDPFNLEELFSIFSTKYRDEKENVVVLNAGDITDGGKEKEFAEYVRIKQKHLKDFHFIEVPGNNDYTWNGLYFQPSVQNHFSRYISGSSSFPRVIQLNDNLSVFALDTTIGLVTKSRECLEQKKYQHVKEFIDFFPKFIEIHKLKKPYDELDVFIKIILEQVSGGENENDLRVQFREKFDKFYKERMFDDVFMNIIRDFVQEFECEEKFSKIIQRIRVFVAYFTEVFSHGEITDEEIKFIESVISKSHENHKFVFLLHHHPFIDNEVMKSITDYLALSTRVNFCILEKVAFYKKLEFCKMIERNSKKITAVFFGHLHVTGMFIDDNNIVYTGLKRSTSYRRDELEFMEISISGNKIAKIELNGLKETNDVEFGNRKMYKTLKNPNSRSIIERFKVRKYTGTCLRPRVFTKTNVNKK